MAIGEQRAEKRDAAGSARSAPPPQGVSGLSECPVAAGRLHNARRCGIKGAEMTLRARISPRLTAGIPCAYLLPAALPSRIWAGR